MKTPRTVLLRRHDHAQPDLDALRQSLVKQWTSRTEPWWRMMWQEVFLPARLAWGALAALALLAAGLQAGASGSLPGGLINRSVLTSDPSVAQQARERLLMELQDQWVTEPATSTAPGPEPQPPRRPQRSQITHTFWIA